MLVTELGCCEAGRVSGSTQATRSLRSSHVPCHASVRPERVFQATAGNDVHDPARPGCGFRKLRVARDSSGGDAGAERDDVSEIRSILPLLTPSSSSASGFDPAAIGVVSRNWDFGDGGDWNRSGLRPTGTLADGDYEVILVVGTPDGRSCLVDEDCQCRHARRCDHEAAGSSKRERRPDPPGHCGPVQQAVWGDGPGSALQEWTRGVRARRNSHAERPYSRRRANHRLPVLVHVHER